MATTVAQFKARFPEYSAVDELRVQLFLDDVALIMGAESRWLSFFDVVQAYYAAHFLTIAEQTESGDSGITAPTKRQEVDDVVIESAVGDVEPTFDELYSTAYGKRVIFYRKICFAGPRGV